VIPGSPEWLKLITASKVAAILGLSPWESPRSLWHLMRGDIPAEPQTDEQARGHYLEPAVLAWFFGQHPEYTWLCGCTVVHDNGWAAATPDAIAARRDASDFVELPVEAKTSANDDEWGTPGTDEIPVYYAAQCMWTMHVMGASRIYVPVLLSRLTFAEYVLDYNSTAAAVIEAKCKTFLDSLTGSEPPPVDGHPATYQSLRRVHPDIDRAADIQVHPVHAERYCRAVTNYKQAETELSHAKSLVLDEMGNARRALCGNDVIATRQLPAKGGRPYLKPARTLPDIGEAA
jgi:putative phage-type endonuclease